MISENIIRILPIAVIMRTALAVWTLTSPGIFPIDGSVMTLSKYEKNSKLVLAWTFNLS